MRETTIADCIERLCQKGCEAVRADIRALEDGRRLPETRGLSTEEVRTVLLELKSIMDIYGDVCRTPMERQPPFYRRSNQ